MENSRASTVQVRWNVEEEKFLIDNHSNLTVKRLSDILGRSIKSIERKIWRLKEKGLLSTKRDKWSKKDTEFLINNFDSMSRMEISERIGKSIECIQSKISHLRKYKIIEKSKFKRWTDSEVDFLKNNISSMSIKQISSKLNKSTGCIISKMRSIENSLRDDYKGLAGKQWSQEDKEFLIKNINILSFEDISNAIGRSEKSILAMSKKLRLNIRKKKNRVPEYIKKSSLYKKFYSSWTHIRRLASYHNETRCTRVEICEEWNKFENFFNWCINNYNGDGKLMRVDNTNPYCPQNCRFTTTWGFEGETVEEKRKIACLKKYGVENPWMCKSVQEKCLRTRIDRYGPDYFLKHPSKEELSFKNYVESFGYKFESTWDLLGNHQIDLYNEELKLAFEYNGLWYHSELYKKDKFYHYNKYVRCKELGICLIHIWQDHWKKDKEYIEQIVKFLFGRGEHPDVDKYDDCIPNGLGLELTEKFKNKKFIGDKDPSFFMILKKKRKARVLDNSEYSEDKHFRIWDAGYSLYI